VKSDTEKWGKECRTCGRELHGGFDVFCMYCKQYENRLINYRFGILLLVLFIFGAVMELAGITQ